MILTIPSGERWVVINGASYREGDAVAGMEIVEIREPGSGSSGRECLSAANGLNGSYAMLTGMNTGPRNMSVRQADLRARLAGAAIALGYLARRAALHGPAKSAAASKATSTATGTSATGTATAAAKGPATTPSKTAADLAKSGSIR